MTRMLPKRRVSGFASRLATATSRGIALLPLEGLAPRSGRSVIPGRHPERRGHTHERSTPSFWMPAGPSVLDAGAARGHRPNRAPLPGRRRFLASAPAALRSE